MTVNKQKKMLEIRLFCITWFLHDYLIKKAICFSKCEHVYEDYIFTVTMKMSVSVRRPDTDTLGSPPHGSLIHLNYPLSVGNFLLHIDDFKPN